MSLEETQIKIVRIMQNTNKPLILNHIAKKASLAPQLVDYHLEQMIKKGLVYVIEEEGKKYYILQPVFYDRNWLDALYNQLTPFILELAEEGNIFLDQVEIDKSKAVLNILGAFLKRFEEEAEKAINHSKSF